MGTFWFNMNPPFGDASAETFTQGKGFWVYNNTKQRVCFRCSGQVSESDANYPMNTTGATAIGNCFPVTRKLGEIVPIAPAGVNLASMIQIQGLNHDGTTDTAFNYMWMGTFWFNMNPPFGDANDVEVPVGKGLWVYNNTKSDKVSLQIAAPEL